MSRERTYRVRGMSCEHCRAAVARAVQGVSGVRAVQVDLASGAVRVSYAGEPVPEGQVKEAIRDAGYDVD